MAWVNEQIDNRDTIIVLLEHQKWGEKEQWENTWKGSFEFQKYKVIRQIENPVDGMLSKHFRWFLDDT